jgi:hypothetical protein
MTTPAPDLSRLRINRDAPAAPLRRALWLGVVGGFFPARRASKVPVVEAIR